MLPESLKASTPTELSCAPGSIHPSLLCIHLCAPGFRRTKRHGPLWSVQVGWGDKAVLGSGHTDQATWRSTPTYPLTPCLPVSARVVPSALECLLVSLANFYLSFAFPAQVSPALESLSWPPTPSQIGLVALLCASNSTHAHPVTTFSSLFTHLASTRPWAPWGQKPCLTHLCP